MHCSPSHGRVGGRENHRAEHPFGGTLVAAPDLERPVLDKYTVVITVAQLGGTVTGSDGVSTPM